MEYSAELETIIESLANQTIYNSYNNNNNNNNEQKRKKSFIGII